MIKVLQPSKPYNDFTEVELRFNIPPYILVNCITSAGQFVWIFPFHVPKKNICNNLAAA